LRTLDKARAHTKLKATLALAVVALATLPVALAQAGDGGTGTSSSDPKRAPGKAKLVRGRAIPPSNAPNRVVRVIRAANRIAKGKGYCYGGGHAKFRSKCYDCSGSVSYALRGGRFLRRPMDSGDLMRWGRGGKGKWITVYSNPGHAYMTVAGLRFDTSMTRGKGPGWSKRKRSGSGYRKRHKSRF
jgi:cell wall-associated NlpC family hydrolase